MTEKDQWRRFAVLDGRGDTLLFDLDDVFYIEAAEHDTMVRTHRKQSYRSTERLSALQKKLPSPPFYRCHASYVVNLSRVRKLERRGRDYRLRLDPPVNKVLPVSRSRLAALRQLIDPS